MLVDGERANYFPSSAGGVNILSILFQSSSVPSSLSGRSQYPIHTQNFAIKWMTEWQCFNICSAFCDANWTSITSRDSRTAACYFWNLIVIVGWVQTFYNFISYNINRSDSGTRFPPVVFVLGALSQHKKGSKWCQYGNNHFNTGRLLAASTPIQVVEKGSYGLHVYRDQLVQMIGSPRWISLGICHRYCDLTFND